MQFALSINNRLPNANSSVLSLLVGQIGLLLVRLAELTKLIPRDFLQIIRHQKPLN